MALAQEIPEPLVRAAQRGDEVALSRLLEAVRPRVYRWALIQTGSPDDAEDIVQEALLRAARALGSFNHAARITTWLHAIVRSTAADWRRTRKRRGALLRQRSSPEEVTRQPEPAGALLDVVRGNLGTLPARQREVFDLIDLQGYTPAEAAVMLAMNGATVRVHLLRARRKLRTRILESHPHIVEDAR
jgi:RNA polymerase sigma-70 factor (ECF subfamily)